MQNKVQHFVPSCYLKAWCDPRTPAQQTPYVWLHKKEERQARRKAPENILCETDYYTFQDAEGNRDLSWERYLSQIEGHFTRIREQIHLTRALPSGEDLDLLCLFIALMENRTKSQRANTLGFFQKLHDGAAEMEAANGTAPTLSHETKPYTKYGHLFMMLESLHTILGFLKRMSKALLFGQPGSPFITSDNPCVLYDPKAYQLPPFWRSPGYGMKTVELTLPLSPTVLFLASWSDIAGANQVRATVVEELNRRVRFMCHEYYVTHDGTTKDYWFDPGKEPDDSWEKQQKMKANQASEATSDPAPGAASSMHQS